MILQVFIHVVCMHVWVISFVLNINMSFFTNYGFTDLEIWNHVIFVDFICHYSFWQTSVSYIVLLLSTILGYVI